MLKEKCPAFIFDLDGVLYNPEDRIEYWYNEDYETFNKEAKHDFPFEDVATLCQALMYNDHFGFQVIFLTGRTEDFRHETLEWLNEHVLLSKNYRPFSLIMRGMSNGNITDAEFKKNMYYQKIEPQYDVKGVFEDREPVIKMWREEVGLMCFALPSIFDRNKRCLCNERKYRR